MRDVTEQVRQEEDRERTEARLRLLETAIDHAVDAIVITDARLDDPRVEYVNPAFVRQSEYTLSEAVGRPIRDMYAMSTDPAAMHEMLEAAGRGETVIAEAEVHRKSGGATLVELHVAPIRDHDGRITHLVMNVHDITSRKRVAAELRQLATHDRITGLLNRRAFRSGLDLAIVNASKAHASLAIMHIGVDRFKEINEAFGYETGDALLRHLGPLIARVAGPAATVARLGGDEFLALLPDANDFVGVTLLGEKVLQAVRKPMSIEEHAVQIDASIGAALYPDHGESAARLLQHAESAMQLGKHAGHGFTLYSEADDPRGAERLALAGDLRTAIAAGRLELVYQPKVRIDSRELVGVEALARWEHPTRGSVPPAEFVALAERTGLIGPLTVWVLGEALRQCNRWRKAGRPIPIAVNVSMRNLRDPLFLDTVDRLLRSSGAPAALLQLEITEGTIMSEPARTLEVLNRLDSRGIHLAIDDFGTGYSSLAYLDKLPVHEVKIDRSFVRDAATNALHASIIGAVVELGRILGIAVVAEGVEDEATVRRLQELGCEIMQGYLVSPAIAAAEITESAWGGTWSPASTGSAPPRPASAGAPVNGEVIPIGSRRSIRPHRPGALDPKLRSAP